MPLGVDTDRFNPDEVKPLITGMEGKFVFLSIMGWSERKGVSILAEAYLREFNRSDNTILYLKGAWYNHAKAQKDIDRLVAKVNKPDPPEVRIDFSLYSDSQLPGLYKSANSFVLASLGEGWGLNFTEAMSMELPTIGTRATSQVDFMTDENSFLIDVQEYRTEPKCNWICPQYIGGKFAIPSMNHLQQLMRQVYSNPELAKEKGRKARKDIVKKWQWKHAANKWFNRLKVLEANL
jgi:glycosyltransferase involved in cell wall biosynthesis